MNGRLFAIGDIHGCFKSFQILIEQNIKLIYSDKVILLGDYIDRGPQSREVIDYIFDLQIKGYNIVALRGNHEAMLIDAYYNPDITSIWIQNGGSETLRSFNITSLNYIEPEYIEFFKGLPYYHNFEEYLFVHAGFNDGIPDPFSDKYSMIWTSNLVYENPLLTNKIIIHGHRPIPVEVCKEIVQRKNNVINIDTGCVYSHIYGYGTLTAIELYNRCLYFV